MTNLAFEIVGARAEPHAAVPTIAFRLALTETEGTPVHAVALQCQIRIEPRRRLYDPSDEERLYGLFGETPQWGNSLNPFLWTHVSTTVASFSRITEVDLAVQCSYDLEVAGAKYLHALRDGEIPLLFLFSGSVFASGSSAFAFERVSWERESRYRLPVTVWREVMDLYYPGGGYLRLSSEVIDRLEAFRTRRALPTWDQVLEQLLKEAGEVD